MKTNKIMASILSLAMVATTLVTFATTASAADALSVSTTITDYAGTDAEFNSVFGFSMGDLESTAKVYLVETTVDGLDASIEATSGRGSSLAYNGTAVSFLSLEYKYSNSIIYSDAYGDVKPGALSNNLGYAIANGNGNSIYTSLSTDATTYEPYKSAVAAAAVGAYNLPSATFKTILVTNTDDFEITVDVLATVMAIKNGAADANTKTDYNGNKVTYPNGATVSPAAPTLGYEFTEGDKYTVEADGINGVVWAGNEMKNVDAANNNYVATFTADGAEPKTRTLTNLPEATTFTFDAILRFKDNTVKSGLAFEVVEEAK